MLLLTEFVELNINDVSKHDWQEYSNLPMIILRILKPKKLLDKEQINNSSIFTDWHGGYQEQFPSNVQEDSRIFYSWWYQWWLS